MIDLIPLDTATWMQLGMALVHFLWQGSLIVCVLVGLLWILRHRTPTDRYAVCVTAMVLMAACPVVTMIYLRSNPVPIHIDAPAPIEKSTEHTGELNESASSRHEIAASDAPVLPPVVTDIPSETTPAYTEIPDNESLAIATHADHAYLVEDDQVSLAQTDGSLSSTAMLRERWLRTGLTWMTLCWLIGVCLLSARLLLGWIGVQRLRRRSVCPLPQRFEAVLASLRERYRIGDHVRVWMSELVGEPLAFGLIRPVVLLPVSAVTQLPCELIEAMIAHELAHIRRHDVWVNLGQRVVETLLFYHPAVWWISGRMRLERELCCDDLAVATTHRREAYAEALAHLAGADRQVVAALGMVGTRVKLSDRVRRVLQVPQPPRQGRFWPAGPLSLVLAASLVLLGSIRIAENSESGSAVAATQRANDSTDLEESTTPNEKPSIVLDWTDTPLEAAVRELGEIRGLSVVGLNQMMLSKADLDKPITFRSAELMTFDDALTTVNTILGDYNYWIIERERYLAIRQLTDWYRRIPPENMFISVEAYQQAKLPAWDIASLVYEPEHRPAKEIAALVLDSVPLNMARGAPVREEAAVQIQGFVYYVDRVLEVLAKWDVPSSTGKTDRMSTPMRVRGGLAPSTQPATWPAKNTRLKYRIGPGDVLQIRMLDFLQVGTWTELSPTVDETGDIHVPQLGMIHIQGMTLEDLRHKLESAAKDAGIYRPESTPSIMAEVNEKAYKTDRIPVRAMTEGLVAEVLVKQGQAVKKGDLLVRLDDREIEIELEAAKIKLDGALEIYKRLANLPADFVREEELNQARREVQLAELEFKRWVHRKELTHISSPVDGTLDMLMFAAPETIIGLPVKLGQELMAVIEKETENEMRRGGS